MSIIEKLLSLQERDCKIRGFEKELRDIPARKKEEESSLKERQQSLLEAEEFLKTEQAHVKEVELESGAMNEKVTKLRQQQMEIKTNKEFKAMELEIKDVETQISRLEDNQLILMEKVDEAKTHIKTAKKNLLEEEVLVRNDLQALDERASGIEVELKEVRSVRVGAAKEIDREWLKRYEQIFTRKDDALVAIDDGICGGCHLKLAPYVRHDAKKHAVMITCDFCGRLLY